MAGGVQILVGAAEDIRGEKSGKGACEGSAWREHRDMASLSHALVSDWAPFS